MINLYEKVKILESQSKFIRIAIVGIGQMGTGLIAQLREIPAFKIVALANRNINRSLEKLENIGINQKDLVLYSLKDSSKINQSITDIDLINDFLYSYLKSQKLDEFEKTNKLLQPFKSSKIKMLTNTYISNDLSSTAILNNLDEYNSSNTLSEIDKFNEINELIYKLKNILFKTTTINIELLNDLNAAVSNNKVILTDNISFLAKLDFVDVVIDATGSPEAGAQIALLSILNNKHVITLNVEADTAIGPILKKLADICGVVYTVAAGDEPAALKELYDFAKLLGFEVIAAGKGKNNPLDRSANPDSLLEYSNIKGASPKMMTSFVDGTKSMLEMTCFSNATGMIPDCRGMHGPNANVSDLLNIFSLKKDGGILEKKGVVDFAIGDVAPGVFLIYTTDNVILKKQLKYLLYGDGPNYLLYRPYHLASMEVPVSIISAYFYKAGTIAPMNSLLSEVITVAKKDLEIGDKIDGIGGFTIYGLIELYKVASIQNLVPIALCEGAKLKRIVKKGTPITYDDFILKNLNIIHYLNENPFEYF